MVLKTISPGCGVRASLMLFFFFCEKDLSKGRNDNILGKIWMIFTYSGKKLIQNFHRSHFHLIFNKFGFLVDITPKIMSKSGSHLQDLISLILSYSHST